MTELSNTRNGIIFSDGSIRLPNGEAKTREEVQAYVTKTRNVNRIYKPFIVLDWIRLKPKFK